MEDIWEDLATPAAGPVPDIAARLIISGLYTKHLAFECAANPCFIIIDHRSALPGRELFNTQSLEAAAPDRQQNICTEMCFPDQVEKWVNPRM
jgi:hypothetical protein